MTAPRGTQRRKAEPKYRVNRVGEPVPVVTVAGKRTSSLARAAYKAARVQSRAAARQESAQLIASLTARLGGDLTPENDQ